MRVIAGKYRGRSLLSPKNKDVRPTTDRIKEDLFNIIMPYLYQANFLDLFAGSGSIGIEAVSRGANNVIMVDNSIESVRLIKENLKKINVTEDIRVLNQEALKYLFKTSEKFDIIFLDPPYAFRETENLIKIINDNEILKDNGIIIVEHDKVEELPEEIEDFYKNKSKKYSLTQLDFYLKRSR